MVALRPYRPEDLSALHAVDVACFEEPFRFSRAALRRFLQSPCAQTLVAEEASSIVGFITVHLEPVPPRFGYVVTLDVLGSHRRTGVGSQLLREGERLASAAGATSMRFHVYIANTAAQSFYKRMGYGPISTAVDFYGRSLDALLLEKLLTAAAGDSGRHIEALRLAAVLR